MAGVNLQSVVNKSECYRSMGGELAVTVVVGRGGKAFERLDWEVVVVVVTLRPCTVEVLNPSCLIAANRSAF